jgi:ribonuclease HI
MRKNPRIIIFTDGSSRGNPGPGGWASVIVTGVLPKIESRKATVTEIGGAEKMTTNNRMELVAAMQGISHTPQGSEVTVYTDSSYLINGMTKWIKNWKRNGWVTKTKGDVLNKDIWITLDRYVNERSISWKYVGGHIGIVGNERCDHIATSFADGIKIELYRGFLSGYDLPNIVNISEDDKKVMIKENKSSRSRLKAYSYVSLVNGIIKIDHSWAECERRVKGVGGARYKKATDASDEAKIIEGFSMA